MLVTITGFGSVWRRRIGKGPRDSRRFARAAYFNTTGVPVNGKIRTRPKIVGHVRFNGVGGFDPNYPLRMMNSVFAPGCGLARVEVGRHTADFLQRISRPAGGHVVDAG